MSEMYLDGIHAKLRRAKKQIQEISDEAQRLCKGVQQGIVREVRDDLDEQVWVYREPSPNAPVEWSVIMGEILYNLRSALDHLVWQLVLVNEQTPGRHNEFPITEDNQRWQQEKVRALRGLGQRHEAMIGYLQPFTGGIGLPFNVSKLKVLNDLCNIEKHRHLIVAVIASSGIEPLDDILSEMGDLDTRPPLEGQVNLAKVESGKVLARFNNAATPLDLSFQVDVRFAGEVQPYSMGAPVPNVLTNCLNAVKGSVEFLTTSMGDAFVEVGRRP